MLQTFRQPAKPAKDVLGSQDIAKKIEASHNELMLSLISVSFHDFKY